MNEKLELEMKIAELEKRIRFLYRTMEKQLNINDELIAQVKDLQTLIDGYSKLSMYNFELIRSLQKIIIKD